MEKYDLIENFGENVFSDEEMKKRLDEKVYAEYRSCLENDRPLGLEVAENIANAMKEWAIEKGATHYTHWFQPMTGVTAEKHDAFLDCSPKGAILKFSGKSLIKGEPDASSFPNGGLRATFEARGYTAWDPSSYAFVMNGSLYIPTVFCSYGGEALDKKTPLLKSMGAINKQALRILNIFGNKSVKRVFPTVGAEQEYFLIDEKEYEKRLDLVTCGRTLFGAKPPKGQELGDHYFGKIKSRVWDYMSEVDKELWKLGVYAKTKHNEVAPGQHELASVFAPANIAVDQNQITMSVMKSVAHRFGMVCILNEKPFAGVNGSGKHNNWSLSTDTGVNLLEPGYEPAENAQFLIFLVAVIAAVDDYQDLLRLSASSAGNDNRLGANEAPPAIVSMFIGEELREVLESISKGEKYLGKKAGEIDVGAGVLPHLVKDKTDRNRTSPFAFTGNKFEFRMVGSNMSIASANVMINAGVADELSMIADELEKAADKGVAVAEIVKKYYLKHKRVIFNGNNYSDEWVAEAKERGLYNLPTTVDAISAYVAKKNIAMFERQNIFTRAEAESRYDIKLENYLKTVDIEARTMGHIARREIIPAAISFIKDLGQELSFKRSIAPDLPHSAESALLRRCSLLLDEIYTATDKLEYDLKQCENIVDATEKGKFHKDVIIPDMKSLRKATDELEGIVGKDYWPFPTYPEIMHSVKY